MSEKQILAADKLLELRSDKQSGQRTVQETILYNLGIGFGPAAIEDESLLRFVLEDGVTAFPTMTAVMGGSGVGGAFSDPEYGVNFQMIVHGEESCELFGKLPTQGTIVSDTSIDNIWDLGEKKGAVLQMSKRLYDATGNGLLANCTSTIMLRGNGGYGGSAEGAPRVHTAPDREPDGAAESITRPEQALVYRLSGDTNPLHSTPEFAKMAGFPRPILHGLCTYGVCARILVGALADRDETRLQYFKLRFSSPVFPGETIRVEYWHESDGNYAFQAKVVERDVIVVKGGQARIV